MIILVSHSDSFGQSVEFTFGGKYKLKLIRSYDCPADFAWGAQVLKSNPIVYVFPFVNRSQKHITSISATWVGYDKKGKIVHTINSSVECDPPVLPGNSGTGKLHLEPPETKIKRYTVSITSVTFSDGTSWPYPELNTTNNVNIVNRSRIDDSDGIIIEQKGIGEVIFTIDMNTHIHNINYFMRPIYFRDLIITRKEKLNNRNIIIFTLNTGNSGKRDYNASIGISLYNDSGDIVSSEYKSREIEEDEGNCKINIKCKLEGGALDSIDKAVISIIVE